MSSVLPPEDERSPPRRASAPPPPPPGGDMVPNSDLRDPRGYRSPKMRGMLRGEVPWG